LRDKIKFYQGFTLIELVLVLMVIAILSAAAASKFSSVSTFNNQLYHDQVLNSIRYAQKLAVGMSTHIQVDLTSNTIQLRIRQEGGSCGSGTTFLPVFDPASGTYGYLKTAPTGTTIAAGAGWPIFFNSLGQAVQVSNCSTIANTYTLTAGGIGITVIGQTGFTQ
jgi:prepilin-type N-terminal cleavage/methylation domain-containing protein